MLEKLIIHLKNIVFFKFIIHIIISSTLFFIITIFEKQLEVHKKRLKNVRMTIDDSVGKESLSDFESQIPFMNAKYKHIKKDSNVEYCVIRTSIMRNIQLLLENCNSCNEIKVEIIRHFYPENLSNIKNNIKLHSYDLKIEFYSKDYKSVIDIYRRIYNLLPNGAFITKIALEKIDVLTPSIIDKLDHNNIFDHNLVNVKMEVRLREIVYEKAFLNNF